MLKSHACNGLWRILRVLQLLRLNTAQKAERRDRKIYRGKALLLLLILAAE